MNRKIKQLMSAVVLTSFVSFNIVRADEISNKLTETTIKQSKLEYKASEIEEKLKKFCLDNGIDGLILLFSVNDPKYSIQPNRTLYKQNFDFGIITSGGIKKQLYFFNNLKILYYTVKSNRLNYPILKRDESLSITQNFKKYDEFVFDTKTKKLLNPEKVKKDFLKDFFYRIDASFNEVFREIKK